MRAISDVATAVTKGDLTRSIDVEAQGEVAALKDNINQMIVNLKETTQKNTEQDWLKTNLAKFSSMMQGQKNLETVSQLIMSELTPLVSAHHGAFFMVDAEEQAPILKLTSQLRVPRAQERRRTRSASARAWSGSARSRRRPSCSRACPPTTSRSARASARRRRSTSSCCRCSSRARSRRSSSWRRSTRSARSTSCSSTSSWRAIGVVLNMIGANMRTEELLQQSQSLTQELQSQSKELTQQQDELKRSNSALEKQALELEEKARLLEEQNRRSRSRTARSSRRGSLEEKAEQLALISKYKSRVPRQHVARAAHAAQQPADPGQAARRQQGENLTDKQVEYAKTIYASGGDLLSLINEILDLSKVEAGKMQVEPREHAAARRSRTSSSAAFRPVAEQKELEFRDRDRSGLPSTIFTDPQRLQQVLKNLLANAFKFTETGGVDPARAARAPGHALQQRRRSTHPDRVIAFAVADTGIGIAQNKQKLIFEAFQQADGTTSRKYGGTGLGLSISREIARLLGGEIHVESEPGEGSTFTLYLPERYVAHRERHRAMRSRACRRSRRRRAHRWIRWSAPRRWRRRTPRCCGRSRTTAMTSSPAIACC